LRNQRIIAPYPLARLFPFGLHHLGHAGAPLLGPCAAVASAAQPKADAPCGTAERAVAAQIPNTAVIPGMFTLTPLRVAGASLALCLAVLRAARYCVAGILDEELASIAGRAHASRLNLHCPVATYTFIGHAYKPTAIFAGRKALRRWCRDA
jgi:hypothetical protein